MPPAVVWNVFISRAQVIAQCTVLWTATAALLACGERSEPSEPPEPSDASLPDAGIEGKGGVSVGDSGGMVSDDDGGMSPQHDSGSEPDASLAPCAVDRPRVLLAHGGAIGYQHAFTVSARTLMRAHHLDYQAQEIDSDIDYEIDGLGEYAAILITDYEAYEALPPSRRQALDGYAQRCDVGLYFLSVPSGATVTGGARSSSTSTALATAHLEADSPLLDLTRDGGEVEGAIPGRARTFELEPDSSFEPVAWATTSQGEQAPWLIAGEPRDGVRRVLNGRNFEPFFLDDLLLMDALAWLSPVELGALRERYVDVDIDDVFMPAYHEDAAMRTVKMQASDVSALIESQARISELIGSDFRFTLGFNAGYYGEQLGDAAESDDAAGDAALVAARAEFYWFDHLWRHTIIVDQPYEEIAGYMEQGRAWAEDNGVIEHMGHYAVTPQHSGTSQLYTPLYEAWRDVWDVRYSSDTSGAGKGFENLGVLVAPRARANIWSDQYSFDQVSRASLDEFAHGGTVYREIAMHPVTLFMTHQANYARDHIGSYMFEEAFAFIARWTRYEIKTGTPDELVEKYFELMPLPDEP